MESATYEFSFEDLFTFCRDGNNSVMDVSCSKTEPDGEHSVSSPVSAAMGSVLVAVNGRSWPSMIVRNSESISVCSSCYQSGD